MGRELQWKGDSKGQQGCKEEGGFKRQQGFNKEGKMMMVVGGEGEEKKRLLSFSVNRHSMAQNVFVFKEKLKTILGTLFKHYSLTAF
jgi:hypothetical protein